jgi:hypothetical protein
MVEKGASNEAFRTLKAIIKKYHWFEDAEMLFSEISKKRKSP